jgi:cytochrome c-type biogenesis protein CcmH/NrfG
MYEQALEARPGHAEALSGMGYIALETGNPAVAASHFQQATRAGFAEAFIGLGDSYRRLGRAEDALAAYRGYLDRSPGGPSANIARGQIQSLSALVEPERPPEGEGADPGTAPPEPPREENPE